MAFSIALQKTDWKSSEKAAWLADWPRVQTTNQKEANAAELKDKNKSGNGQGIGRVVAARVSRWGCEIGETGVSPVAAEPKRASRQYRGGVGVLSVECVCLVQEAGVRRGEWTESEMAWRAPQSLEQEQKAHLAELLKAGPKAAGFQSGCWNAAMIQHLIEREFGVLHNVHYVAELLGNLGFSFQKARFVSDHLDTMKRLAWLTNGWPSFLAQAKAAGGLLLFGALSTRAQQRRAHVRAVGIGARARCP